MNNPYHVIISYQGDNWEEFLEDTGLIDIFKELLLEYKNEPTLFKCLIRYIVWAYSKESDKIHLGVDWLKNKKQIYESSFLPQDGPLQDLVLRLKDVKILSAVKAWVAYQDNDTWSELTMLKDLRVEMQVSANSDIKTASGEISYDQKFKNAKYSIELYTMIKEAEAKLMQNDPKMKDAIIEVRKALKTKATIGPEAFAK